MRLNLLNIFCDRAKIQSEVQSTFSNVVPCSFVTGDKNVISLPLLPFEGSD